MKKVSPGTAHFCIHCVTFFLTPTMADSRSKAYRQTKMFIFGKHFQL